MRFSKLFGSFLIALFIMFFTSYQCVHAQIITWTKGFNAYYLSATLDTLGASDTTFSDPFTLEDYDDESFYSYPLNTSATATAASGTPKVIYYYQGSYNKTSGFANVDTLKSTDSTYTNYYAQLDLNNRKYPWYRIAGITTSVSGTGVISNIKMYQPRKDIKRD